MRPLKRFLIFYLFLMFPDIGKSQFLWQFKKDTIIKWYYFDGDEFDLGVLDKDRWIPGYSYSEMNYQFQFLITEKRIQFDNGVCKFICDRDTGIYNVPAWQLNPTFEKDNKIKLIDNKKV